VVLMREPKVEGREVQREERLVMSLMIVELVVQILCLRPPPGVTASIDSLLVFQLLVPQLFVF
jgi:hypothetical protein